MKIFFLTAPYFLLQIFLDLYFNIEFSLDQFNDFYYDFFVNLKYTCFNSPFLESNENAHFNVVYFGWNEQFYYIFIYVLVSAALTGVLFFVAFILSQKTPTFEKLSPYECGFEPFGTAHQVFNIQYYIIGILFMIFDLEVAYLIPWAVNLGSLPAFSFWLMVGFILVLIVGFIYEWKKGALDWV
jgi:NADH-quinone oxidoreductase subunit A